MLIATAPRIRLASLLFVLAALMFAPSAFARGHHNNWGISLGFSGPGYSIGYSDCRHCGRGYVSGSIYGGYSPGYYGSSYSSSYYGGSYSPGYYDSYYAYSPGYYNSYYPSYGSSYYGYSWYRPYSHHRRVVSRRVVRYDNYYDNDRRDHRRGHDDRRERSHRSGDDDRGYSRRAAYYDRRN